MIVSTATYIPTHVLKSRPTHKITHNTVIASLGGIVQYQHENPLYLASSPEDDHDDGQRMSTRNIPFALLSKGFWARTELYFKARSFDWTKRPPCHISYCLTRMGSLQTRMELKTQSLRQRHHLLVQSLRYCCSSWLVYSNDENETKKTYSLLGNPLHTNHCSTSDLSSLHKPVVDTLSCWLYRPQLHSLPLTHHRRYWTNCIP